MLISSYRHKKILENIKEAFADFNEIYSNYKNKKIHIINAEDIRNKYKNNNITYNNFNTKEKTMSRGI